MVIVIAALFGVGIATGMVEIDMNSKGPLIEITQSSQKQVEVNNTSKSSSESVEIEEIKDKTESMEENITSSSCFVCNIFRFSSL